MAEAPDLSATSGETQFIDQYTRRLMIEWCHSALTNGTGMPAFRPTDALYRNHAIVKKWLNKDGKVISAGWKTAAAFLKR